MASLEYGSAWRWFLYSGTPAVRLRRPRAAVYAVAALACAMVNGGCALSIPLDSVFGNKTAAKEDITSAFAQESQASSSLAQLQEVDLAHARSAAVELLARGRDDASAPWENPDTGARGTVTPVAASYKIDGVTCRDFLASYIRAEKQTWLQGEACRTAGRWEVKSLKPLKRT